MRDKLPDTWKLMPLEDCMDAIIDYRGKTPKKVPFGIPLITAKIVKGGQIIEAEQEYIASEYYDEWMQRGLPKRGDVVMTTEGPLGEIAQLDGRKVALGQRLITLRGNPHILDNTFLKFLMLSDFVQNQLHARATGTTVQGIKQSELRKVTLLVPPLPEQQALATILGSIDEKVELNRQMNKTLEAIATAIYKSWFVDFDPVRAKLGDHETYGMDAEMAFLFPDSIEDSELGEVPRGWQVDRFSTMIELISGGTPKTSVPEYWNGSIPWFSIADIPNEGDVFVIDTERKITQAGLDNSSTRLLAPGTTIITARGTVGKCALVGIPMAMNQSCYGVRGNKGRGNYFTYFALLNLVSKLQQSSHGTIFNTITRDTFETIKVVCPAITLTQQFDKDVSPYLDQILLNLHESRTLTAIRDALLPKLLLGEIRVKDAEKYVQAHI
jgi:type I restriction enzyme S subunit